MGAGSTGPAVFRVIAASDMERGCQVRPEIAGITSFMSGDERVAKAARFQSPHMASTPGSGPPINQTSREQARLRVDNKTVKPILLGHGIYLTPDQAAFIRQAIEAGRLHRPEEAVREALSLWEERERRRAEILAAVDAATASLATGKGRVITEDSMRQLADEVKQRGRARLAAEQQTPR
jgi:Arc/MetJ-type ribon-helix-helix transcriptional regulator